MKKKLISRLLILLIVLICAVYTTGAAESYTGTTMRLLRYEGTVEIEDASGKPRFIMENARFNSGEAMRTGAESLASVGLDGTKIVTLDAESRVEFQKNANSLIMKLTQGSLLLDVQEKLTENESLDIQTSTMVVGIRGTIIFVSVEADADAPAAAPGSPALREVLNTAGYNGGSITTLGVLEGTAQLSYKDDSGAQRVLDVSAGQKATLVDPNEDGLVDTAPAVSNMTADDLSAFISDQIEADPSMKDRINNASDLLDRTDDVSTDQDPFSADGDWTWDQTVTLVAQSASKLYDGQALTRPSDVLVYNLPSVFTIRASAGGSRTDAGESPNPISHYAIYNAQGENVTRHFSNVETVAGLLRVDPAPLTVWTASAQKEYDGTPLTDPEAKLLTYKGYERNVPRWRNSSFVVTESVGSQTLYGISGVTWTHGTNPLTGETQELHLYAGQKMNVYLSTENGAQSINFEITNITEEEIPDELLRLYAENPDLLTQACTDTGWNRETILNRISALPPKGKPDSQKDDLRIRKDEEERLMLNSTNVRITIDSDITNYNGRALNDEEAHYTPVRLDEGIYATATGSQTPVGESVNAYEINWAGVNPANYVLSEELGTLTVTPNSTPITLSAASAKKTYDGKTLSRSTVVIRGVPDGFTCTAEAAGSRKNAGTTPNLVSSYTILNAQGEDVTAFFSNIDTRQGLLSISKAPLTIVTGSATKAYDGSPLTCNEVEVTGLVNKEKATVTATGSNAGIGETTNTYTIDWDTAKKGNYTITEELGTLEVIPGDYVITITSGDGYMRYRPWDCIVRNSDYTVEGLPEGFSLTANITGEQAWDIGSSPNTIESYRITDSKGKDVTAYFTDVNLVPGTLTIDKAILEIWSDDAEKVYDGTPVGTTIHYTGIYGTDNARYGVSITHASVQTDVGSSDDSFNVYWNYPELESMYEIEARPGKLTVTPKEITITTGSAEKAYDGTPLTSLNNSVDGLVYGEHVSVTPNGSITDVGETQNTYTMEWGTNTKSSNYKIKDNLGTLTVTKGTAKVTTSSASKAYDGTPLTSSEASITGPGLPGGVTVTANGTITDVGSTDNTYTIDWGGVSEDNYIITEELGTLEVKANTTLITFKASSGSKVYDGEPLTATVTATGIPAGLSYTAEAGGSQTHAGTSNSTVASYSITDSSGKNVTSSFTNIQTENGTLEVTRLELIVYVEGTYKYDGQKHYGNAKVTGASCTITNTSAGTWTVTLPSGDEMRLTAVGYEAVGTHTTSPSVTMINGSTSDYSMFIPGSDIIINKNDTLITITAGSATKVYDGTALTTDEYTVEGLPGGLTYSCLVVGDQTAVGEETTHISGSHIRNSNGDDVWTNFTNIVTKNGTLTVTPKAVTITTGSATKAYDGTPLTSSEVTISGLVGSDSIEVQTTGKITDVGSTDNTYTIVSWGADPNNYSVSGTTGTLTVTKNTSAVTFTAGSADKTYDGSALTKNSVTVSGLPSGFTYSATASGSQTNAGESANTVASYAILDSGSNNVTGNFSNVTTENGTLKVNRATLTVKTSSAVKPYDGTPLTNPTATISGLVNSETATVAGTGSITNIGKTPNTYKITWGTASEDNYSVNEELGELEVYDPDPSTDDPSDTGTPPSTDNP